MDFVEDFETSPEVATVSAEIDVVSPLEAASTGIPDLSGLTIAPAVDKSIEQDGQDLFFDDAGDETTDGEINYSVLEEFEEE